MFENRWMEIHNPARQGREYVAKATVLPLAGDLAARVGDAPVAVPFEVIIPKPSDRRRKEC